ncbi:MAG: hypothetical protein LUD78_06590 [Clostridiales bacterium]|nr:hypothetical protein [Clostridiales bacterium]
MLERLLHGFTRPKAAWPAHFDTIVSLGFNCEVSFRIRDHLGGKLDSYPFSWCYVYGNADLPRCMEYPETILSGGVELQSNGMFLCKTTHLSFHGKTPLEQLRRPDGREDPEAIVRTLQELRGRMAHLEYKFQRLLERDRTTLFVMKNAKIALDPEGAVNDVAALALWLEQHYRGGNYLLVVVTERAYALPRLTRLENDHLTFRTVSAFAKEGKAQSGGDQAGWAAILDEFDGDRYALRMFE